MCLSRMCMGWNWDTEGFDFEGFRDGGREDEVLG